MKATYYLLFILWLPFATFSQDLPIVKVGEEEISVKKLKINTSVVGDIAVTTFDMYFFNPNDRVLEGELSFPLGEGQSVVRFALEVNDHLRDAVVVEKEKARVAFESTVRKKIDPALLEQTKGNNYKARIYPIPAKGYKRVVLAFQQKLTIHNSSYYYKLPLNFKHKLEEFSFDIQVLNQENKPVSENEMITSFNYNAKEDCYDAKISKKDKKVAKPVLIKIPLNSNKEKVLFADDYFYFTKKLNINKRRIALENKITLFWDASLSQKNKKITAELALLNLYFKEIQSCKVNLVVFNTQIRSDNKFIIKKGNWATLKKTLENIVYDGASSFNSLATYKSSSKINLLFSDGLNTLSDLELSLLKKIFVINSTTSANHIGLKNIANTSGGVYLNLNHISVEKAFSKFKEEELQFLGTNLSEERVEVYPKKGTTISEGFSISGKGDFLNKEIKLMFGYGTKVLKTVSLKTKKRKSSNEVVTKIWAQKKLEHLLKDKNEKEKMIVDLSKQYQIMSPFTSMLILDRVEDYVIHKIAPPEELRKQYDVLIAKQVDNRKERFKGLQKNLMHSYKDYFTWYDTYFELSRKDSAMVFDRGLPRRVNGVSVIPIAATTLLQATNKLVAQRHPVEVDDYRKEALLKKDSKTNFSSNVYLDEVVVIGYGIQKKTNITGAVSSVSYDSLEEVSVARVDDALRGSSSGNQNSNKLYVVDGIVVGGNPNLNSNEIASIEILENASSSAVFGSRGANGVVVVTTKKGLETQPEKINEFKRLVAEKIELKGWNPDTPYLTELKKTVTINQAYKKYLELRKEYGTSPSFYIDVADFFKSNGDVKKAIQILTNVAEIDLDNYELLKALAYKFEEYKLYDFAVYTYKEILKLRPEDVQSYRDLALVYEYTGAYQKSADLLYQIVNGDFLMKDENRRFLGVEVIALNEFNRMLHLYKKELKIQHYDKKFIKNTPTEFRIVIDWNHNDTDIDLWVIDPEKEKCYYSNKRTKTGGLMSNDMTQGFGPEQFVSKGVLTGTYKIKAQYYSNSQQKVSGPTFFKVTVYKYHGTKNEIKTTQLIRLEKASQVIDVGEVIFERKTQAI